MPVLQPAAGPRRAHLPAPERLSAGGGVLTGADAGAPAPGGGDGDEGVTAVLERGELTVRGRIGDASNAVLYCEAELDGRTVTCVYKPVRGERPLWDFPDGTLAQREVATRLVSEATGWGLVPPTVLRDGPYGTGMCQQWIEADPEAALLAVHEGREPEPGWRAVAPVRLESGGTGLLVHADTPDLRRLAVLDAVVNNADRKGGHLLPTAQGRLYAIDHGVTFHVENKLRTLLWGWAGEPLPEEAVGVLEKLRAQLGAGLGERLGELLTAEEVDALRERVADLLGTRRHPEPGENWPTIPWPPV